MSESGKAVFLSYASQDAEAAKRIAEALRTAGVEVWFDQNELRGGDAWDQKIRRQIKECALFVPVISANTDARPEGYFRLEWKLAVDRSHLLADDHPFLFPIVVGDMHDATARVPEKFREVQWTRVRLDESPAELAARVARLLGGSLEPGRPRPGERGEGLASPRKEKKGFEKWWWLIFPILGMSVAIIGLLKRPDRPERPTAAPAIQTPAPLSEARKLANQAMQFLEDPNFTRETSWLADELCERALRLDAGDAEIWAVAALVSVNLYWNTYDTSAARREKIGSQAARAVQLDPNSVRAGLAAARSLDLNYEGQESLRMLRALHQRAPEDQHVIFHLVRAEATQRNEAAVQELMRKLRALPRTGMLPLTLWFWELRLRFEGRFAEAEAIIEEMLAMPGQLRGAYYEKLNLLMGSWHDLAEVEPFLAQIPVRYLQEPAFGSAIAQYWLWRGEPEKTLQALARVPQDYFEEYSAREPKALLAGWAHALAGRPAAAQAEWRNALALIEGRLRTDSRNFTLLNQRALLLALTGQSDIAREAWQLRVELGGEQERPSFVSAALMSVALNDPERAAAVVAAEWPALSLGAQARMLPVLRHHPGLAAIRDDARLQSIFAEGAAMLQRLKSGPTGAIMPVRPAATASSDAGKLEDKSVAVLAFANLSDDKANEYFSDGISEELLNVLAKVPGLKVSARTSAFHFKGKNTPIPEIARQLGVAYVIEGSVRKQGDKVRITAQLIKAADGFHVWSDTFTRDVRDVFAVQDEIAGLIAKSLSLQLGVASRSEPAAHPVALSLLTQGRHFWALRTREGFARAGLLYAEAIRVEPRWGRAYAALANLQAIESSFRSGDGEDMSALSAEAERNARRAIELDPHSSDAYAALGKLATDHKQWAKSAENLAKALELDPNSVAAHDWNADYQLLQGRLDLALAGYRRALELDPLSPFVLFDNTWALLHLRRFSEMKPLIERAIALTPNSRTRLAVRHAHVLLRLGLRDEAAAALRPALTGLIAGEDGAQISEAVWCLRELGWREELDRVATAVLARPGSRFSKGLLLAALGRMEEAYPHLMVATPIMLQVLYFDPVFDPVRDTPGFKKVLAMLGCESEHAVARQTVTRMLQEGGSVR